MAKGQEQGGDQSTNKSIQIRGNGSLGDDFVLEKSIFSNIFEKDVRRVFIYKKAERLAKAIHLVSPAFENAVSLRNRMDSIAIGLVDAAILAPGVARTSLSRELLALSSVLSIARTSGLLSAMNAELIGREAQLLLQEVAAYEEPRLFLDDALTLPEIAKRVHQGERVQTVRQSKAVHPPLPKHAEVPAKKPIKDTSPVTDIKIKDRQDAILSVIRSKGSGVSIKDISTVIRDVSEKTIQRELLSLVAEGTLKKEGERRWSTYSLA